MDEDFALWNFLEEERDRQAGSEDAFSSVQLETFENEDMLSDDELTELLAEKLGQGITRQGGNY